jgi:NitT/TauT family transport system ATP-binding protein
MPHTLPSPDRPSAPTTVIDVRDLTKTFARSDGAVLAGLSFHLAAGETLSVIGPSGCGKTTLLYILAGLQTASTGNVRLFGRPARATPGRTAFILQHFGLFPWKTVFENVALGLKLSRWPRAEIARIVTAQLDELGLNGLAKRYPVQLSGGQKQRVAVARALATSPDLLLMDEPFSSLDALTREHLQNTVLQMWQRRRLTYVTVTHSVEEAVFLGRYILVLSDRPTVCKALLANRHFGKTDLRHESAYFDMVRTVRGVMEI